MLKGWWSRWFDGEREGERRRTTVRQASRYQAFKKADFIVRPTVPHHPFPTKQPLGDTAVRALRIRACPADQGRGRLILCELLPGQRDHVAGMNVANLPRARRASAVGAVDIIAAQQGNGDATRPLVSARMGRLCRKEQKAGDDQAQSWVQTPPEGGRMAL